MRSSISAAPTTASRRAGSLPPANSRKACKSSVSRPNSSNVCRIRQESSSMWERSLSLNTRLSSRAKRGICISRHRDDNAEGNKLLRFNCVELLKRPHMRIKRPRTEQLRNLPDMTKVMKRPFVQQMPHSDLPVLFVLALSPNHALRHITQPRNASVALVAKHLQMVARFPAAVFSCFVLRLLIVIRQLRTIRLHHALDAFAKSRHFHVRQMRQHFADGPSLHRRLPLQLLLARQRHQLLQYNRRLLQHFNSRQRNWIHGRFHCFLRNTA